mmetsp:Transcript_55800/g.157196  ORF Transcript_55800/g.157196 Transcript_55800/m.157196 type:complete len:516 (+) Transcript_55800:154-1701(+)
MAPINITVRIGTTDNFPLEVDDEESVEELAILVISVKPELGEEELPRLVHKGKILKEDGVALRDIPVKDGDFVVAAPKRPAGTSAPPQPVAEAATAAAANAGAIAEAPAQAAQAADAGQAGGEPSEAAIEQLSGMGFDRPKVVEALRAAFNNPERAVEFLFNGIPAVATQPAATPQPAASQGQWPEGLLGPQLLSKSGLQATRLAIGGARVVLLYFSAHWCPPCRQFTPRLAAALAQPVDQLAVVFVSSDRDDASFTQYYREMPWLAVPFNQQQAMMVSAAFGVRGIPNLVVLDAQTGQQISADGRGDVVRSNFDIAACLRCWGVAETARPTAPPAAAPAAMAAQDAPTPVSKREEPAPLPIDDDAADAALARVRQEAWEVQEPFFRTGLKILDNVLQNPDEPKFRQLKLTNAALSAKLFNVAGEAGLLLMGIAGFIKEDAGVMTLAGPPDGCCTAVRDKMQAAADTAWETHARAERDARITEEMEKDKHRQARYGGSEKTEVGRQRRGGGGGGG